MNDADTTATGAADDALTMPAALLEELGTEPDFEHRRIFASARKQLLGMGAELRIGRFRARGRLGTGGMGEVYLCHDDELDRKVAVKRVLGLGLPRDQERLRLEAQALARLSHPNVVQVYETGVHEGRTFVAMEYIDGQTLAGWLDERPSQREVLDRFLAAGRGLAAAHGVGIVHRDFKPDNVLIGKDGTVRVADFGVALAEETRGEGGGAIEDATPHFGESRSRLSVAGSVVGTMHYMPLEQVRGERVDARGDQFAFCVALYEALWDETPFSIASPRERIEALEHGQPRIPSGAPGLWRVIRRGLSRAPDDRWSDMDALLRALARVPLRRRRWIGAGVATATLGLGIASFSIFNRPVAPVDSVDPCSTVERELEGVWDVPLREHLGLHIDGLDVSHVGDSQRLAFGNLDHWSEAWVGERTQVCRERQALASVPDRLRLQDSCLTRQRQRVAQLVELLAEADANELGEAVKITGDLAAPSTCASEQGLLLEPPSRAHAPKVEVLRLDLARVHDLRLLGRLQQALTTAELVDHSATTLGYGPLMAEARAELARAHNEVGSRDRSAELYEAASLLADSHHHDRLRAELLVERAWLSLFDLGDVDEGAQLLERAAAAHNREQESDPGAQARLSFTHGRVLEMSGERDRAQAAYRSAIAELEGDDHAELPTYYDALARVVGGEEALELRRAALALSIERFGPRHPRSARWLYNYGIAAREAGQGGEDELELAAEIWTEVQGQSGRSFGKQQLLLARESLLGGDLDEVERRALVLAELHEHVLPAGHPDRGEPEQLLAVVAGIRGDAEGVLTHGWPAVGFFETSSAGRRDPRALQMRTEIANSLLTLGRLDDAAEQFRQVRAHVGDDSAEALRAQVGLAEVELRRGNVEKANDLLRASAALGDGDFVHAFLTALVALRRTRLSAQHVERLTQAREQSGFADGHQLRGWFDELRMTATERRKLGL